MGKAMGGIQQAEQNQARGHAEYANSVGMEKQKLEAQEIFARKLILLERDQTKYLGSMRSDFAKSGIDFSGSALEAFADTTEQMRMEKLALKAEEAANTNRYDSEIAKARRNARSLTSNSKNGMIIGAGFVGAAGDMEAGN